MKTIDKMSRLTGELEKIFRMRQAEAMHTILRGTHGARERRRSAKSTLHPAHLIDHLKTSLLASCMKCATWRMTLY